MNVADPSTNERKNQQQYSPEEYEYWVRARQGQGASIDPKALAPTGTPQGASGVQTPPTSGSTGGSLTVEPFVQTGAPVFGPALQAYSGGGVPSVGAPAQGGASPAPAPAPLAPTGVGVRDAEAAARAAAQANGPQPLGNDALSQQVKRGYLSLVEQDRVPDAKDPAIVSQREAFEAATERARRNAMADAAEGAGPYATGALQGTDRMLREEAAINSSAFAADLVGREIQNRRAEILAALNGLAGVLSEEDRQALQRELAQLNAQMEQSRLSQQDRQFSDQFGLDLANTEAFWNNQALRAMMGGQ
jgi:hypothetical protein